jgi:hypothetical protein
LTTPLTEREWANVGPRSMKTPGDVDWCWQTITALQFIAKNLELDYDAYERIWAEAEEHEIWTKIPPGTPFGSKETMLEKLAVDPEIEAKARVAVQTMTDQSSNKRRMNLKTRIALERPDIYERMLNGEFPSNAAAARAAGFNIPGQKRVSLTADIDRFVSSVAEHYTPEQLKHIGEKLIKAAD